MGLDCFASHSGWRLELTEEDRRAFKDAGNTRLEVEEPERFLRICAERGLGLMAWS